MRRAFSRWRRRTVWGLPTPDVVLAVVLLLIAVGSVVTGNPNEGPLAVTVPVAIVSTLALAWRRRHPLLMIALVTAAGMGQTLMSTSPGSLWSLVVEAVALYSAAAYLSEAVAAVAGTVFVVVLLLEERIDNGVDYVFILLLFGGVWLLGRASAQWRGRVTAAERRQREAARLAVAEERVRIARDLHDVVAHSLSVIAVQSDAAEAALEIAPERALTPVRAIRTTAREALTDIRGMLDVLRTDDDELPGVESPGVSAITGLADAARSAGTPVALEVRLTRAPVTPGVDLAAYRIVQECLTNARRHAPGAATTVTIVQGDDALRVSVVTAAPAAPEPSAEGSGYGISGMRERAAALGGRLQAQPTADGGFEVEAVLPLGRRETT
ncbi:sensor histidine kinase [Microbacterium protaetiae]|uniref:histidine kinase n=1 Tax=Microbacterium protaetiae TaxID=2509458 RepID=A0A4P6EAV8_9MICO|nr:sensor histidine kinase [Microbacterium protaetiae]QAY58646.1 sensor histidine kinase [Microbacterium protaetiae]